MIMRITIIGFFLFPILTFAYGGCLDYGMAIETLDGKCQCMSGFVWGEDLFGDPTCVSGSSACRDQYGYNSTYDSLSGSCECTSGYVFEKNSIGQTQCVSADNVCRDRLGYGGDYDSYSESCTCKSGYELSKTYGDGYTCKSCSSKYGIHSSYDYISEKCECDDGYTLKDGECVEKQNNVYFYVFDLDTEERQVLVANLYTEQKYIMEYRYGCYNHSFEDYVGDTIVINLGTDFSLDTWDIIVLPNDGETCDISRVTSTSRYTLDDEISTSLITPQPAIPSINTMQSNSSVQPVPVAVQQTTSVQTKKEFEFNDALFESLETPQDYTVTEKANMRGCPDTSLCAVIDTYGDAHPVSVSGYYNNKTWAKIVGPENEEMGWIYYPLIETDSSNVETKTMLDESQDVSTSTEEESDVSEESGWFKNTINWISTWFN